MKTPRPTLKRGVTHALLLFVLLTTLASASLVVITSVLHETTETLSASVETIRIAKDAQRDLLLHARSRDGVARSELANELRGRLADARQYVSNEEENQVLQRADARVSAYLLAGDGERERIEPPAYEALGDLVRINLSQAAEAQQRASRLDLIANVVGFGTAIAVVVGALLLGWWVRARALRPVLGLARAMQNFGRGNETERAPEDGPEELGEMGRQFNGMADRLAEQRTAHRTYLAAVAHDLRNPLGTLRLAVDTFVGDAVTDPARSQRMMEIVRRQIDRMTRLAEDLLDTANLEAGHFQLKVGDHDLRDVARATAELFSTASSRHAIELALPEESTVVPCDAQRMEQVLANLVGNAIKYSPQGGTVRLSIEAKNDTVEMVVEDRGVGMTAEEVANAFQPFTRAATLRKSVPGHGLGLFIVQRIVEEHGGSLRVDSTPGRGSRFRVVLPLDKRAPVDAHALH